MPITKTKIITHCVVKNEENWIWFALMSIIDFVDEILVLDTGSKDNTIPIIKAIKSSKIKLTEMGDQDATGVTYMREIMLQKSRKADWIFNLDGDEVWPQYALKEVNTIIKKNPNLNCIISPYISLVGDIYHKLPDDAGRYQIHEFIGNYSIRFFNRKIPGLKAEGRHGNEKYVDKNGTLIQELPRDKMTPHQTPYWHFSHLKRSSLDKTVIRRSKKFKFELGRKIDTQLPEVFFFPRPNIVPDPLKKMPLSTLIPSLISTPLKITKRRLSKN